MPERAATAVAACGELRAVGRGRWQVRFIILSFSTSITWFRVLALLAHSDVPTKVLSSVTSHSGPPAIQYPIRVEVTTRALSFALESSL